MADLATLRKELEQKKQNLQSKSYATLWRPESGENIIRILPRWDDVHGINPNFYQPFAQHFIKSLDGKVKAIYMCDEAAFGEPCPVCDALRDVLDEIGAKYGVSAADIRRGLFDSKEAVKMSSDDEQLVKIIHDARAVKKGLFNALVLTGDSPETPQMIGLPATVSEEIIKIIMSLAGDNIWALDPKEGHDFVVTKEGAGRNNTKYSVSYKPKARAIDEDCLEHLPNLEEYIRSEATPANQQRAIKQIEKTSNIEIIPALPAKNVKVLEHDNDGEDTNEAPVTKAKKTAPLETEIEVETKTSTVDVDEDDLEDLLGDLED